MGACAAPETLGQAAGAGRADIDDQVPPLPSPEYDAASRSTSEVGVVGLGGAVVRRSLDGLAVCIIALLAAIFLSACATSHPSLGSYGWGVGEGGVILATTDGGAHWVKQHSGTTDDLNDVAFADVRHGWAVGASRRLAAGVVLATTDGGAHWVKQLDTALHRVAGCCLR